MNILVVAYLAGFVITAEIIGRGWNKSDVWTGILAVLFWPITWAILLAGALWEWRTRRKNG